MGLETIIAGGITGISAIANAFSGDDSAPNIPKPPKPKKYTEQDLKNAGWTPFDKAKQITQLSQILTGEKEKGLQTAASLKFAKGEVGGTNDVWANVAPLAEALQKGTLQIEQLSAQEKNDVAKYLFSINAQNEENYQNALWQTNYQNAAIDKSRPSFLEKFFEGGLEGLNLGTKVLSLFPDGKAGGDIIGGRTETKDNLLKGVTGSSATNNILNFAETTGRLKTLPSSFDEYMSKYNPERYRLKNLL